jgi:hypothetical protein
VSRLARVLASLTVALIGAGALAACSTDSELDSDELVDVLPAAVLADHPDLLTDVVCPPDIELAVGVTTVCFADLAGDPVELTVVQVDDDGRVRVEVDRALLDVEDVAARIAEQLSDDIGVATAVVCDGPPVRVLEIGTELRCDATDPDDRTNTFVATILDEDAAFDLRIE